VARDAIFSLCYHDVVDAANPDASGFAGDAAARYKLTWAQFTSHLDALAAALPPPAAVAEARDGDWLLTFDDGGHSALEIARALTARGWTGHFFVTAGSIGAPGFVDAEGVRELSALGQVVGSHSWSHPERMSSLTDAELEREWRDSRGRLEEILGTPVTTASVAGGYHSPRVATAAAAAGMQALFTSEPIAAPHMVDGCRVFGRYAVLHGTSPTAIAAFASGARATRLRQFARWNVLKVVKAATGPAYPRLRRALLRHR
jgi:peptidoglycan/xylan/chitin deacetylase (PgdA/CDA1 family)